MFVNTAECSPTTHSENESITQGHAVNNAELSCAGTLSSPSSSPPMDYMSLEFWDRRSFGVGIPHPAANVASQ